MSRLRKALQCPECHELCVPPLFLNPNNPKCAHTICYSCASKHFQAVGKTCPICGVRVGKKLADIPINTMVMDLARTFFSSVVSDRQAEDTTMAGFHLIREAQRHSLQKIAGLLDETAVKYYQKNLEVEVDRAEVVAHLVRCRGHNLICVARFCMKESSHNYMKWYYSCPVWSKDMQSSSCGSFSVCSVTQLRRIEESLPDSDERVVQRQGHAAIQRIQHAHMASGFSSHTTPPPAPTPLMEPPKVSRSRKLQSQTRGISSYFESKNKRAKSYFYFLSNTLPKSCRPFGTRTP